MPPRTYHGHVSYAAHATQLLPESTRASLSSNFLLPTHVLLHSLKGLLLCLHHFVGTGRHPHNELVAYPSAMPPALPSRGTWTMQRVRQQLQSTRGGRRGGQVAMAAHATAAAIAAHATSEAIYAHATNGAIAAHATSGAIYAHATNGAIAAHATTGARKSHPWFGPARRSRDPLAVPPPPPTTARRCTFARAGGLITLRQAVFGAGKGDPVSHSVANRTTVRSSRHGRSALASTVPAVPASSFGASSRQPIRCLSHHRPWPICGGSSRHLLPFCGGNCGGNSRHLLLLSGRRGGYLYRDADMRQQASAKLRRGQSSRRHARRGSMLGMRHGHA
jgi:hypothetical protein